MTNKHTFFSNLLNPLCTHDEKDICELCSCNNCSNCLSKEPVDVGDFLNPFIVNKAFTRMILCSSCGNKRCPKATDHRLACTNSNEPGQPGSSYS